jgi:hypothetical protein
VPTRAGLVPASLYVLGRDAEGLLQIAGTCGRMPPAGPENDARASLIALVMLGLGQANQSGHFQRDEAARHELVSAWLTACEVSESDLQSVIERMQERS